jgi:hypothetical protein
MMQATCLSKLDLFFIGLSPSHDPSCEFVELTQLTLFLNDFFKMNSICNDYRRGIKGRRGRRRLVWVEKESYWWNNLLGLFLFLLFF